VVWLSERLRLTIGESDVAHRALGDLPGAGEKARRDAGGIPVADVGLPAQSG